MWWLLIPFLILPPTIMALSFLITRHIHGPWSERYRGVRIYGKKCLKTTYVELQLETMMVEFIKYMSGGEGRFDHDELVSHLSKVHCHLRTHKLKTTLRPGEVDREYNGLTHSKFKIEVAVDKEDFWDKKDGPLVYKTALLYELLNACLWALEGYEMAYAETFLDADDKRHWRLIPDVTGDGQINNLDVERLQKGREAYDRRLGELQAHINGIFLRPSAERT